MNRNILNKFIKYFSLILLCSFISGCDINFNGLNQPKKDIRTVIQFSSWGSESEIAIIKPVIKEFERQNPDIRVEFIHIPKNYFQKLHLLVAAKLTPDVVFLNNINGPVYAENNILLNLSEYLKKDNVISEKDFFKQSLDAFTYNDKLYAVPRDISNLVIYYNKDIFDKYKVPYPQKNWSFDDFLLTAQKLTKDTNSDGRVDQFGIGFETLSLFWMPFLWSNSGDIISSDLKTVMISKPESIKAFQFYANLRNKYHVAPKASESGSATMSQLFMQGKLAMQINGRWSVPRYRKDLTFRWDIAEFPSGSSGSIVDADTSGWAISKSSKHPLEAWKFVRFLASKQTSARFTESGLIIPARIDVANSEVFLDKTLPPQHSKLFIDIIRYSKPTPIPENYQEIMDEVNAVLEPVWNGEKQAKEALDDKVVKKINCLMKN